MTPLLVTMGGASEHFWQPCEGILAAKVHSLGHLGSLLTHWGTVLLQKLGFACHGEEFALVERPFGSKQMISGSLRVLDQLRWTRN